MNNYGFLVAAFIIVITVLNLQRVSALKCYRCSSDAANAEFCNDSFDANDSQSDYSYVECLKHPSNDSTPRVVCKKLKKLINQKEVIVRTCHWEKKYALRNDCYKENVNSNGTSHGKIVFCETCDTDGCNTASSRYKSIAILISPIFIVKILVF